MSPPESVRRHTSQGSHPCSQGGVVLPLPPSSIQRAEASCPEPTATGAELGGDPSSVEEDVSGCVRIVGSYLRDLKSQLGHSVIGWSGQFTHFLGLFPDF